jgi:triosephosphate isomerase
VRRPIIAGNWKMNLGIPDQAIEFVRKFRAPLQALEGLDIVICPPFTVLAALAEILKPTPIGLGAQNMHWEASGAHTGEIAPGMLTGLCRYVIIGHSERRASGGHEESDEALRKKVEAAFKHALIPILCVGENLSQRQAGETQEFVSGQVRAALQGFGADALAACVIAYEPIWAIGTGVAASPADANSTISLTVRGTLAELAGEQVAEKVRVLYGGSVTAENAAGFLQMPEIDGALVGGASLKEGFIDIARAAIG